MSCRKRLIIADDYPLLGKVFRSLLEPEFEIVGVVENGHDVVKRANALRPDIVILDVHLPGVSGLDAGEQLKRQNPSVNLIFVSADSSQDMVAEAFKRGAAAYVSKNGNLSLDLIAAVRVVSGE